MHSLRSYRQPHRLSVGVTPPRNWRDDGRRSIATRLRAGKTVDAWFAA